MEQSIEWTGEFSSAIKERKVTTPAELITKGEISLTNIGGHKYNKNRHQIKKLVCA